MKIPHYYEEFVLSTIFKKYEFRINLHFAKNCFIFFHCQRDMLNESLSERLIST